VRKPKGSYVRNSPDWFIHRMMSGSLVVGLKSGFYTYIGLQNNDSVGRYLYLHGLRFSHLTGTDGCYFGLLQTSALGGFEPAVPLDPLVPAGPGQVGSFYSATSILGGKTQTVFSNAQLGSAASAEYEWQHDWPIATIPPGWAAVLQTQGLGEDLFASFWWFAAEK